VAPVGRPGWELPGLILALDERHGPFNPITRIMAGMAAALAGERHEPATPAPSPQALAG
jgi:hypothetical protein